MRPGARWAAFAGATLLLAGVVTAAIALVEPRARAGLAHVFARSAFYGISIGFPSMWLLPRVGRRVQRLRPLPGLAAMLAVGVLLTAAMMALATATLAGLGVFPPAQLGRRLLTEGGVSVLFALPISVGAFGYARLVGRLRARDAAVADAERLAAEARLASLAARLQPHFLFNTLNSIATLVREDPRAAERTVERLASVLRSSLDAGAGRAVPLQRELDLVSDYVELERVRLGGRLRFALAVEPGLEGVAVPPFAVQTLVENAVKYAVAPRREGGAVRVELRADARCVHLEVRDDGPGIHGPPPPGHGLDMLARRLEAGWGAGAGLRVARAPEGGAHVHAWWPRGEAA